MAKLNSMTRASSSFISSIFTTPKPTLHSKPFSHSFSTTKTPFPLQYEMIITQPPSSPPPRNHRRPPPPNTTPSDTHLGFDDWVDMKLTQDQNPDQELDKMDKNKRKYYNKREKRMYGLDDDNGIDGDPKNENVTSKKKGEAKDEKGLVFFEEKGVVGDDNKDVKMDVTEKKVEEFFKCLKKVPDDVDSGMPFVSGRSCGLPPKWDGPNGAVLLVNKPKGWTSFTVCGKLRRLVNVKKVGHAGTLDPMATGLLIVCIGKATKVVDRFQGMVKGYSGVLRLGEATSTLDADSPVIQREPWEHIKDDDIKKTAATFCGEIWQVPPMFSAIKVGGERLYEKARRGENIELSPRRISIFQFDVERSLEDRFARNPIFYLIQY
ncbi:hypothetical protein CTI12_AA543100 [Artemisia annua]|uniref:tRNA pseudouridine(55) synthase n=1 Tax=Artemisia annua TaxID=35608 RepID=A0A2U1L0P1_ARTAN|nr:hypothetical protein CTI12_AA543100 [Artemisia annua]